MTSLGLALTMLRHQKGRTVLYLVGVLGAALLLFLQLGFLGSLSVTATQFTDAFRFDLAIVSKDYLYFNNPGRIPRERLGEAAGHPAVAEAIPIQLGTLRWPTKRPTRAASDYILVLATEPAQVEKLFQERGTSGGPIFGPGGSAAAARALARHGDVLLDRSSRPEYGTVPAEGASRWATVIGPLENAEKVRVVGGVEIGTGFAANALLLSSLETLDALQDPRRLLTTTVNLGLLQLKDPATAARVKKELERRLPADVYLFTRDELAGHERDHWTKNLPVGRFFVVGVFVAFGVGVLFIYQMMVGDIRKHQAQYATLKALGYGNGYLTRVVLWQGLLLGLAGFVPAVLVAYGLFAAIRSAARIALFLTPGLMLLVFVTTLAICLLSSLFALRKVYEAAPADLF